MAAISISNSNPSWTSSPMTRTSHNSSLSKSLERLCAEAGTLSLYQNFRAEFGEPVFERAYCAGRYHYFYFMREGRFYRWCPNSSQHEPRPSECAASTSPSWIEEMLAYQAGTPMEYE